MEASVSAGEPSVISRNGSPAEQSATDPSSKSEVSEFISPMRAGDNVVGSNVFKEDVAVKDNECAYGDEVLSVCGLQFNALVENENSDEELMEDCDNCSEVSEIDCSQSLDDVYSVDELNEFLDLTKGKKVDVVKYFPDVNKFIKSVVKAQKTVGYDVISKQKRFRLKKFLATVRKAQKHNVKLSKGKKIKHMGVGSIFIFVLFFWHVLLFFSLYPVMQILRLGSLNVNGMRDGGKRALLNEFLRLKEAEVIFLQETHSDIKNESELNLWWRGKICFIHGTNVRCSVFYFQLTLMLIFYQKWK